MTANTLVRRKNTLSFGWGTAIQAILMLFGLGLMINRWVFGLGATTALSDPRPWGLWISFDILAGIALAAGAFTMAAIVYVFNVKEFHPLLRPTILTGFLGYSLAILGLTVDLGKPLDMWHMIIYWNVHAPLFEIGWCVMTYATVMALELSPMLFERLNWNVPLKLIRSISIPLIFAGIVLSTMHQSSLGTLYVEVPDQIHPLWWSIILPPMFYVSAIGAGMCMIIFESTISGYGLNHKIPVKLLGKLAGWIPYVLGFYLVMRFLDLILTGDIGAMFAFDGPSIMFWVEILLGYVAPIVFFSMPAVRKNRYRLFWVAFLGVFGLLLNRFNVSWFQLEGAPYFPAWQELFISIGLIAFAMFVFNMAARFLPLFEEH